MGRNWIKKIRIAVRRDERWKYNKTFLIEQSGRRAENKTGRALNELIKKGKIKGYRQTERYSREDMQGIDFIILSLRGNHIFLQIKSFLYPSDKKSLRLKEIMMGIWWHETGIYNIEARIDEKPNQVAEKILRILEFEDKKFQEQKETYLALNRQGFLFITGSKMSLTRHCEINAPIAMGAFISQFIVSKFQSASWRIEISRKARSNFAVPSEKDKK